MLKELVAALQDEDKKGPKVQQQLAEIAIKRWGNKLNSDKITSILGKHPQPEYCEGMAIARVNSEIWAPLNASKRKADLRLANMQQVLQKVTMTDFYFFLTPEKTVCPLVRLGPYPQKLNNKNLSSVAKDIIIASWCSGTGKQYQSYLGQWEKFCAQKAIIEEESTVEQLDRILRPSSDAELFMSRT